MLFTFGIILLFGLILGKIFNRFGLPSLIGMILLGIVLSSCGLVDNKTLEMAPELRKIALVIILTRAGLSLNLNDLKKSGRPAILMCFLPATFEILGCILILPRLFGISLIESALAGSVISAVSPAVTVPRMIKCINEGYGSDKGIPQMILAGASADDVFVMVLFTSLCKSLQDGNFSPVAILKVPISIVLGIAIGIICGAVLTKLFDKFHIRDTEKVIIIVAISFGLLKLEDILTGFVCVSGLLAIMSLNLVIRTLQPERAKRLSDKFNKVWSVAEIILFTLVGIAVDLTYLKSSGVIAIVSILGAIIFRMFGVLLCLIKTNLNRKERLFCMISYCPKATVQAGIGSIPLSMGFSCGNIILTLAVVSILITAPIGAILIDRLYTKLLKKTGL
ncbi:MAG: cation:proton antiporter [Oscillospiraceae bacterium]